MSAIVNDARSFLEAVAGFTDRPVAERPASFDRATRLATIDTGYTTGNPRVLFDGETTMGLRTYAVLGSSAPRPGSRVVLLPVGSSFVILGPVDGVGNGSPFAMDAGTVSLTVASGGNFASGAVVFAAGRFTSAPVVTVTLSNAPNGSQKLIPRSFSKTATGVSVAVYSGDFPGTITPAATVTLDWTAVQMSR